MSDRVNFKETRLFVGIGVICADGDLLFQELFRLCPAFPFEGGFLLVRFQQPVYADLSPSGRADGQKQFFIPFPLCETAVPEIPSAPA
jgi:hypothetical protein